jgi:hypothetical protein
MDMPSQRFRTGQRIADFGLEVVEMHVVCRIEIRGGSEALKRRES